MTTEKTTRRNWRQTAEKRRSETKSDLEKKLEDHKKCALVRCTGFGKTTMMVQMTKEYERVLFLYPADTVKNAAAEVIKSLGGGDSEPGDEFDVANVTFMTYMKLVRMKPEELMELGEKYDLIIMDEVHKIGAEKTGIAVRRLMAFAKGRVIGATGTAERRDSVDVINDFFDGVCVEPYTLKDAFDDGIIRKPIYTFLTFDAESDFKEAAFTDGEEPDDVRVKEVYKQKFFELKNIMNVPSVIADVTMKYRKNTSRMKYIVFFSNFQQLHSRKDEVEGWFRAAFPGHTVETLIVTSETREFAKNVDRIKDLPKKKNHINLIMCVDMLNLGTHIEDLTGIVMYRATTSPTIYSQQIGRVLSSGSSRRRFVFDLVDNLHRRTIFDAERQEARKAGQDPAVAIVSGLDIDGMSDDELIGVVDQIACSASSHAQTAQALLRRAESGSGDDRDGLMAEIREFLLSIDPWWNRASRITEDDVEMATIDGIPYEAKYRELIGKLVAVPIYIRAKRAADAYKARYEQLTGKPFPTDPREAEERIKGLGLPYDPYAIWQGVSVKDMLDVMFGKVTLEEVKAKNAEKAAKKAKRKKREN